LLKVEVVTCYIILSAVYSWDLKTAE